MLTCALSLLTACSFFGSSKPDLKAPIALPVLDADLRTCARPVEIPEGALAASPAVRLWAKDRQNLATCAANHTAIVGFYDTLRAKLVQN